MKGILVIAVSAILLAHPVYDGEGKKYMREWWNIDAFFNAGKNYSITASFEYEKETPAANLFLTIFSHDENKFYDLGEFDEDIDKLIVKDGYVEFEDCWLKTHEPYEAYFCRNGIEVYMLLDRISPVKKIAGDVADAIPFGFGYYNYTFASKCVVSGWIKIKGRKENLSGIGYYEHVYGNWSYNQPFKFFSWESIKDYISLYKWWKEGMEIDFKNITVWSNNPFGYDWAWGFFDNGWTIFFGNIPFWLKNIPMGIIYIYDGNTYREFKVAGYEYIKGIYYNGSYFPAGIRVFAFSNKSRATINFETEFKPHIYEHTLSSSYWKKLILYESPGKIYGWINGSESIFLNGKGEIEMERQNSIFDYASLSIQFNLPVIKIYFVSYLLKFGFHCLISFFPFYIHFSFFPVG